VARFGHGVVRAPSRATAFRVLEELERRHPTFRLSAKRNRDIADRPEGACGKLRPTRPGEYVLLDTTRLDVFALDPVTLRWINTELTVAMDWYDRCVVGLRLAPVSTKSVDAAAVLYQAFRPRPAGREWPAHAVWPEHGIPRSVLLDPIVIERPGAASPAVVPETIVVDHGKIYLSEHLTSACARLGISIVRHPQRWTRHRFPEPGNESPSTVLPSEHELRTHIDHGLRPGQIARLSGCSHQQISKLMASSGIGPPAPREVLRALDSAWLREQYEDNHRSFADIAADLGIPPSDLARHARQVGLAIRHGVAAHKHILANHGGPAAFSTTIWAAFATRGAEQRASHSFSRSPDTPTSTTPPNTSASERPSSPSNSTSSNTPSAPHSWKPSRTLAASSSLTPGRNSHKTRLQSWPCSTELATATPPQTPELGQFRVGQDTTETGNQ
jgi:transposase InsO family protein